LMQAGCVLNDWQNLPVYERGHQNDFYWGYNDENIKTHWSPMHTGTVYGICGALEWWRSL
jgi:hypothetical protein